MVRQPAAGCSTGAPAAWERPARPRGRARPSSGRKNTGRPPGTPDGAPPCDARRADGTRAPPGRSGHPDPRPASKRSEEHTSELQSQSNLVCRLLLEKKKKQHDHTILLPTMINNDLNYLGAKW